MVHFYNTFVFESLLKDYVVLKISFFSYKVDDERRPETALTISFPFLFLNKVEEFKKRWPEPAYTIPFPVNKFLNKLALTVPNNILKNPPNTYNCFCDSFQ